MKYLPICKKLKGCKQKADKTFDEFVDRFEKRYKLVMASKEGAYIPKEMRAFIVLRKVRITDIIKDERERGR